MITTPNGVRVRKSNHCFYHHCKKCKTPGCECSCHKANGAELRILPLAGRCPICNGSVKEHHGDVVECSSCGQQCKRQELRESGHRA